MRNRFSGWSAISTAVRLALILAVAILAFSPRQAEAHARATSFSYWKQFGETVEARLVYPWVELQQAFPQLRSRTAAEAFADDTVRRELSQFFSSRVRLIGGSCEAGKWTQSVMQDRSAVFYFRAACAEEPAGLAMELAFAEAPSHVHLIRYEKEGAVLKGALTSADTAWPLTGGKGEALPGSFAEFFQSGFLHILGGLDHVLFLLGLLLLAPSLAALAGLATGFTLSHSIALVVAVLGVTRPDGLTVEALIGFTVAFSGLEAFLALSETDARLQRRIRLGYVLFGIVSVGLTLAGIFHLQSAALLGTVLFTGCFLFLAGRGIAWRWLLVFFFGFVHGFGFAGPLTELELTRANFAQALLGFNLGVEAGQLLFLVAAWPILKGLSALPCRVPIRAALAACVLAAGIQWFLLRAVG